MSEFDYQPERWVLHCGFDSLADQQESDPELAYPNDEVSRFVAFIGEQWGMITEDLMDYVRFSHEGNWVDVQCDVIDPFQDILTWLVLHTSPRSVTLTRTQSR